jgi:hypothetical protein
MVNMTRDAKLLTSEKLRDANQAREAELAKLGILIPDTAKILTRLEAFYEVALDADGRAALELAYQRKIADGLDANEGQARQAAAAARLGLLGAETPGNGAPHPAR